MANYKSAYSFCEPLAEAVIDGDTCLVFSAAATTRLCNMLGDDGWTYLLVDTILGYQEMRVSCVNGKVVLDQPFSGGGAEVGAQIYFDQGSPENMCAWYECKKAEIAEDMLDVKSETLDITLGADGRICIELKDDADESELKWQWCGKEFYVKNGKIQCRATENPLVDGIYPNATITVEGGKIVSITKGCAVVQSPTCDTCLEKQAGN